MTTSALQNAPAAPFDVVAANYDRVFTESLIGRAQRNRVWEYVAPLWHSGDRILELNCGTGEDALHLASRGVRVTACDASSEMIRVATRRKSAEAPEADVALHVIRNEEIGVLSTTRYFDGVLSNFSGLNCIADLDSFARDLAPLVRPDARIVLCFSSRFCAWEFLWYVAKGELAKAFRRWSGETVARLGEAHVEVRYPTVRQIARAFAPWFALEDVVGVGVAIPPSYAESWAQQHARLFGVLARLEPSVSRLPLLRVTGDHYLLRFRRCAL